MRETALDLSALEAMTAAVEAGAGLPEVVRAASRALDTSLILPALMAWIMFGIGCAFFFVAGRILRLSHATTGGLMLTGLLY